MAWINNLSKANIPFTVYKLDKEDSLVYSNNVHSNQILIIIHGIINATHVYKNHAIIPLTILSTGHILSTVNKSHNIQSYYKYTALKTTYIVSFSKKKINVTNNQFDLYIDMLNAYHLTLQQYKTMKYIFIEKEIKYRLIKLIIFLFNEFGIVQEAYIALPFSIKQKDLAVIIGSNTVTINKIIQELSKELLIRYTYRKKIYINNIYIFRYYSYLLK